MFSRKQYSHTIDTKQFSVNFCAILYSNFFLVLSSLLEEKQFLLSFHFFLTFLPVYFLRKLLRNFLIGKVVLFCQFLLFQKFFCSTKSKLTSRWSYGRFYQSKRSILASVNNISTIS